MARNSWLHDYVHACTPMFVFVLCGVSSEGGGDCIKAMASFTAQSVSRHIDAHHDAHGDNIKIMIKH